MTFKTRIIWKPQASVNLFLYNHKHFLHFWCPLREQNQVFWCLVFTNMQACLLMYSQLCNTHILSTEKEELKWVQLWVNLRLLYFPIDINELH